MTERKRIKKGWDKPRKMSCYGGWLGSQQLVFSHGQREERRGLEELERDLRDQGLGREVCSEAWEMIQGPRFQLTSPQ